MVEARPQPRPPRGGFDGDRRRRRRALGSQGAAARAAACDAARRACARACRSTAAAGSPPTRSGRLAEQFGGWVEQGIPRVKMKVGRTPTRDPARVAAARAGDRHRGGAVRRRERRLRAASRRSPSPRTWRRGSMSAGSRSPSPPTTSQGCVCVRDRAPAGMEIAAGEYGYTLAYFARMLAAGAVDCLQADVTRCEGITGFLRVGGALPGRLARALRALRPRAARARLLRASSPFRHLEYFHDHVRIERHALRRGARACRRAPCSRTSTVPATVWNSSAPMLPYAV